RQPVALLAVARAAGGDDVLPDRLTAAASRDDVVDGEPGVRLAAAVLAGPGVAREHRLAGDLATVDVAGHAHVAHQPNDAGADEDEALRVQGAESLFDDLRPRLQHEDSSPPHRAD